MIPMAEGPVFKRMIVRFSIAAWVAIAISACAGPKFPETGTPTPYDGRWVLDMASLDNPNCNDTTGAFEVRYGYAIGLVEWRHENYKLWGQIDDNGTMAGLIGQMGVAGATAEVSFRQDSATGTWESRGCGKGTLKAHKISG